MGGGDDRGSFFSGLVRGELGGRTGGSDDMMRVSVALILHLSDWQGIKIKKSTELRFRSK